MSEDTENNDSLEQAPEPDDQPAKKKQFQAKIEQQLRVTAALEDVLAGKSYDEVAAAHGWNNRQSARKAVQKLLKQMTKPVVDEYRQLELMRIDKMWELFFLNAQTGDNFALASCIRMMEHKARLLGLYAPVKNEHTGANGEPLAAAVPVLHVTIDAEPNQPTPAPQAGDSVPESGD